MKFIDITGQTYGRLTAIKYIGSSKWEWSCSCGNTKIIRSAPVKNGHTSSCGCLHKEKFTHYTHGMSKTSEYHSYNAAKARCTIVTNNEYHRYGAKGIKFLFNTFEEFINEVGRKPSRKHSIDRIKPCGNYEVGNIRWATPKEQANNKISKHNCSFCTQV